MSNPHLLNAGIHVETTPGVGGLIVQTIHIGPFATKRDWIDSLELMVITGPDYVATLSGDDYRATMERGLERWVSR